MKLFRIATLIVFIFGVLSATFASFYGDFLYYNNPSSPDISRGYIHKIYNHKNIYVNIEQDVLLIVSKMVAIFCVPIGLIGIAAASVKQRPDASKGESSMPRE